MTREEQIIKASHLYAKAQQKPFLDGARWADRHPTTQWLDKACEWLLNRMWVMDVGDEPYVCDSDASDVNEFIEDFKQAMLEKQQ